MKITGLQKVTLIDFPGNIACSIFLHGCNLRCGFCHNPGLVTKKPGLDFSEKEILDFLEKRKEQLSGVCITGGEPLMSLDKNFVKKIKQLGYQIKIDTNGYYPDELSELIKENLVDYVALDIKASKDNYEKMAGKPVEITKIEQSIILTTALENYELRTTVIKNYNTKEDMLKMAKWLVEVSNKKPKKFCLQSFIKKASLVDECFNNEPDTSEEYLLELKELIKDFFEEVIIRV